MARIGEGLPKLWIIHRALVLRKEHPEWFGTEAAYTPFAAEGKAALHVVAYGRGESVAVVVPRLPFTIDGAWQKTTAQLPEGRWTNRLTGTSIDGGKVAVEIILQDFPVALLTREVKQNASV